MQHNRRAMMRREKRAEDKIMNAKSTMTEALMQKAFVSGKKEGLEIAVGIIFLALHEDYGFGKKRLENLIECIKKESMKMDEDATKFNVDWYIQQLNEKCNIKFER